LGPNEAGENRRTISDMHLLWSTCSLSELLPRQGESYTRTQQTANKTQRYIQTHLF